MRQLWHLPTLHLPCERMGYVHTTDAFERDLRRAWEEAARQLLRRVARFSHVGRIHVFAEGMLALLPLCDATRSLYEIVAAQGSIQMRLVLGLESLGARLYAVDTMMMHARTTTTEQALNDRQRDEDFSLHIMRDVPDGQVALLILGAAHQAERLIRQRAADFEITRIGTMQEMYEQLLTGGCDGSFPSTSR